MQEIKFRFIVKDKFGGLLGEYHFTLDELQRGYIQQKSPIFKPEYFEILSRDQFIDLKDKNGREIHNNDIIKHQYSGLGRVVHVSGYKQLGYYLEVKDKLYRVLYPAESYALEVVGNITEHPHLLGE